MKTKQRISARLAVSGAILCGLLCLLAGMARGGEEISAKTLRYVDLLKRVMDVEQIAFLPDPGERAAQFSSYDRRSRVDAQTGKSVEWAVNDDFGNFIREENGWQVMAEAEGPGCIWRMWSATPTKATVKVIIDGREVVSQPFEDYFMGGTPFDRRNISYNGAARGWNSYLPIPFNKSMKIVTDAKPGSFFFYHVNWSQFPDGTKVESFSLPLMPAQEQALDGLDRRLGEPSAVPPTEGQSTKRSERKVDPGESALLFELQGPQAVQGLSLELDLPDAMKSDVDAMFRVMREWMVEIRWDDETEPSVRVPFGDFFGGVADSSYRSFLASLSGGKGWCGWLMPFAKSAEILIRNEGDTARMVRGTAVTVPLSHPAEKYGRFHAKWHRDEKNRDDPDRSIDWSLLKVNGRGRYIGCMLHVWNPLGLWWGEGDEKFFVDGERFPSTFGTGTEDYFGYAWCCPDFFERPLHSQPRGSDNRAHVCVNRWHTADAIPFQKSFDGSLEKYFRNGRGTLYAATAFFYLEPGVADGYRAYPLEERRDYCTPNGIKPVVAGAQEAENLRRIAIPNGKVFPKVRIGWGELERSNEGDGTWEGGNPGDVLKLGVKVPKDGLYLVEMKFSLDRFSGMADLSLADQKLVQDLDLYAPTHTGNVLMKTFGPLRLKQGEAVLEIQYKGRSAESKGDSISFDFIRLLPSSLQTTGNCSNENSQ